MQGWQISEISRELKVPEAFVEAVTWLPPKQHDDSLEFSTWGTEPENISYFGNNIPESGSFPVCLSRHHIPSLV